MFLHVYGTKKSSGYATEAQHIPHQATSYRLWSYIGPPLFSEPAPDDLPNSQVNSYSLEHSQHHTHKTQAETTCLSAEATPGSLLPAGSRSAPYLAFKGQLCSKTSPPRISSKLSVSHPSVTLASIPFLDKILMQQKKEIACLRVPSRS